MKTEWWGDRTTQVTKPNIAELVMFGQPRRPGWPDVDATYLGTLGSDSQPNILPRALNSFADEKEFPAGIRAICLAPDTDHDYVRLFFGEGDDENGILLAPGMLVRPKNNATKMRVAPALPYPATRLIQTLPEYARGARASVPLGQAWRIDLNAGVLDFRNVGPVPVQLLQWNGSAWVAGPTVNPNAFAGIAVGENTSAPRPADYSLDGRLTLADLVIAGAIVVASTLQPYAGPGPFAGGAFTAFDAHHNQTDQANPTTVPYPPALSAPMSSLWQGACGLWIWEGEDPWCGFAPRLAPERVYHLKTLAFVAEGTAGTPDTPVFTTPATNVDSVQLTFQTDAGAANPLDMAIGMPLYTEQINRACKVTNGVVQAPASAGAIATIETDEVHTLMQIVGGGNGGASLLGPGATVVLRRRFVG